MLLGNRTEVQEVSACNRQVYQVSTHLLNHYTQKVGVYQVHLGLV